MSETEWKEDHIGKDRYGYRERSKGVFTNDEGEIDRINGRNLETFDQPNALSSDNEMDLHFKGVLVDTSEKPNRILAERRWNVYGHT
jgi:hypothetical protein